MPLQELLLRLRERRIELGMPIDALVARSGLPRATVCRLLSGAVPHTDYVKVAALGEAMGVSLVPREVPVEEYLRQQVEQRADEVVGAVQGNMGLEAQGLNSDAAATLRRRSVDRLSRGPRKNLW